MKTKIEVLGLSVLLAGIGLFLSCGNREGNIKKIGEIEFAGVVNSAKGEVKCLLGSRGRLIKQPSAIALDVELSNLPKIFHAASLDPGSYIRHRNNPEDSKTIEVLLVWEDKGRMKQIEILDIILNEEIKGFLTVENLFFTGSSLSFPACPPGHRLYLPGGKCGFCDLLEASEPVYKIDPEIMPGEGMKVSVIFREGVK